MVERRGLFVGIGIDGYDSHEPLQHAVAEVKAVAEVLGADFAGEPLLDADLAQVLEHLKAVPACLGHRVAGDAVVRARGAVGDEAVAADPRRPR